MNISLTPELEQFVQAQIQSGAYKSESEICNIALRMFCERKKAMDYFIQTGMDSEERVGLCEPQEVWDGLEQIILEAERRNAL